jgi:hypothetical protein
MAEDRRAFRFLAPEGGSIADDWHWSTGIGGVVCSVGGNSPTQWLHLLVANARHVRDDVSAP